MATLTSSPTAATPSRGARARTRTSRAGASSSGFTFIELAIVLLLVGILLFFAVPKFGRLTQGSLKAATRRMYGVIATVHDKAALQKRRYWLGMELGRGEWWVVVTEPAEGVSPETILLRKAQAEMDGVLPGDVVFTEVLLEGRQFKEGTALAVFEPNGTCTEAQINLEDGGGSLASMYINPLTGRCSVSDSEALRRPGGEGDYYEEEPLEDVTAPGQPGAKTPEAGEGP